jgi:hypothetical protein
LVVVSITPSCPALCRVSTPYFEQRQGKGVDGRDKPGHDGA